MGLKVLEDHKGYKVHLELEDLQVLLVIGGPLVKGVVLVSKVLGGHKDQLEFKDHLEQQDHQGHEEKGDLLEELGVLAYEDGEDQRVTAVVLVQLAHLVKVDLLEVLVSEVCIRVNFFSEFLCLYICMQLQLLWIWNMEAKALEVEKLPTLLK